MRHLHDINSMYILQLYIIIRLGVWVQNKNVTKSVTKSGTKSGTQNVTENVMSLTVIYNNRLGVWVQNKNVMKSGTKNVMR